MPPHPLGATNPRDQTGVSLKLVPLKWAELVGIAFLPRSIQLNFSTCSCGHGQSAAMQLG